MCSRPRMIDSDTTGNFHRGWRGSRGGSASFTSSIKCCNCAGRGDASGNPRRLSAYQSVCRSRTRKKSDRMTNTNTPTEEQPALAPVEKKVEETPFEAVASICSVLVVGLFILTFLGQNFVIPSGSMENTLLV